jgi:choline transport protein
MPVEANNMNYISVILVGYMCLALVWWFIRGKNVFRGPSHDDYTVEVDDRTNGGVGHPI